MHTKVSVIIPVYNGEHFISRAIQSALSQSVKPFEVIVINDGSIDGTAEKLASFGKGIKVLTIPNGGVANARNMGIKASSGEIIAFLDADDVWFEDKLKSQLAVFEHYPEVGFCCCDFAFSPERSKPMERHFSRIENNGDINFDEPLMHPALDVLIKRNIVGTCSNVAVRRKILDQVGLFNTSFKQSEDYEMWLRLALVTKFVLLSAVLLEKNTHETNLTNNFLETSLCHEKVLMNLKVNGFSGGQSSRLETQYRSAIAKVRYEIGNLFYEANQKGQAFQYFFLGLGSNWTLANFQLFSYYFSRKLVRTISFGIIRSRQS